MTHKEHRIYQYLSEPLTFMGMTVDELTLALMGITGCLFADALSLKTFFGVTGIGGVFVLKRAKKWVSGFSLASFLHWYFGIMPKRPSCWPPSHQRYYLS